MVYQPLLTAFKSGSFKGDSHWKFFCGVIIMEFNDVIKSRRSIRKFKSDPIPDSYIKEILEAGRIAPSASNLQSTRYVVIKSEEAREKMNECTLPFVTKAPVIIACCTDTDAFLTAAERSRELMNAGAFKDNDEDKEKINSYRKTNTLNKETAKAYLWENAGIAVDHMTLKAVDLGLGSCWIGIVDREKAKKVLELEDRYDIVALLPIGYPDQNPAPRPRLSMEEVLLKEV